MRFQLTEKRLDGTGDVLTEVVGADFESLIASHHETDFLGLLVLQQTDVARTTLLPLRSLSREPEELRPPVGRIRALARKIITIENATHILKRTCSSSSWVLVSTCSVSLITGSK